jgi:hypothetical protein
MLKKIVISALLVMSLMANTHATQSREMWERAEFDKCATDYWYFITHYCYTCDPDAQLDALLPDYEYAKEFIDTLHECIAEKENLIDEKSRQMTMSWYTMAYELWALQFSDADFSAHNVSRGQDEVDNSANGRNYESLHGKVAHMYERLPAFLQLGIEFQFLEIWCKIIDPVTGKILRNSHITGESANENASRSGSYTMVFLDEAAHMPYSEKIYASSKKAAKRCLLMVFTPLGMNNAPARVRHDPNSGFRVVTTHWSRRYSQDWYVKECRGMTKLQIAQELDISYINSVEGKLFTYSGKQHHAIDANGKPVTREAVKERLKTAKADQGMDAGFVAPCASAFAYMHDKTLYFFDEYSQRRKIPAQHAEDWRKMYDSWGGISPLILADPEVNATEEGTGRTLLQDYRAAGLKTMVLGTHNEERAIRVIEQLLQLGRLKVHEWCTDIHAALEQAHAPTSRGNATMQERWENDDYAHILDSIMYVVLKREKYLLAPDTDEKQKEVAAARRYYQSPVSANTRRVKKHYKSFVKNINKRIQEKSDA